jgi:hypothetical protein
MPGSMPVRVTLKNGSFHERSTMLLEIEGSSMNPLTPERLHKKFRSNALRRLSTDRAEEALRRWADLTGIDDVPSAVKLLC